MVFAGRSRGDKVNRLRARSLNDFSRLGGTEGVLSCQVPGSGMSRREECKNQIEKVVQRMGPGLFSFHMKDCLSIHL